MARLCRPARHGVSSPAWFAVVLGCAVLGGGTLFGSVVCAVTAPSRCPLSPPLARVEKKLHAAEKRLTPVKTAPAPPQQVCVGVAIWVPGHCGYLLVPRLCQHQWGCASLCPGTRPKH